MHATRFLNRTFRASKETIHYGGLGKEAFGMTDMLPDQAKQSDVGAATNFLARKNRKSTHMLEKQGWGKDREAHSDGAFRDLSHGSHLSEDLSKNVPGINRNVVKDIHDEAGERGLEAWKEANQHEMRATHHTKRYVATQDRDDIPAYMHWMVPQKHVRLEQTMQENERRFLKTPEYDLPPTLAAAVQKMWDGLEVALVRFPLPFHKSKENFCITHIECCQTKSEELWLVCWKLTMDASQRAQYEKVLSGTVLGKWSSLIHRVTAPSHKGFKPIMRFVYDDGTIPFKETVLERNISRAHKGLPPIEVQGGVVEPEWQHSSAGVVHDIYAARHPRKSENEPIGGGQDKVQSFLEEARTTIDTMKLLDTPMSQPSKGGVGFHDEEKMERSTVRAPQPPGKKGEKKRVRKQTLHQSGILALTTPAKPRKSIFRSKLEKGMKVEEEVPPELMSPVSPLEREANPHVTCICSVVACCVQLKGDVLGATLSEMMCYAAELRALESVVNGFVEIMKGEQVTRNLGFSTRRDSSASNASLEGDLLLLEASLDELGATLCLVGEHIATQRSREDTEQTDLRASLSSDLTSLMSSVQLSRAVWRQRDMNVASIEIMAGDLLQEVNTARKALAQHDSAMPIDTSTPVQEGCTASEVPTTIQSSRRENGTQTSPCEDPEVGRLRSLLNGANRRFGEAQDELALLRTQQNEAGAGSTDTQHRRNTVMVDAEVDARATMVAATVQCGGCGADTDTQTDCRGFDIDSLERTADALRAAVKEAEDRLSHYKVRQVAEAQTHGSEEQRLLGMIAAGTKKVASLEEALVRVEKSSAAEVQRIRSDIVPRLQGEMCVMNAKYRAMLQQTADAIAGRKRAEEALQESLLKREEPQTALPCRELEELRKNMATLKEENRVLLAQLGKFKHRSVVLSRYETHSTTLCKELQEERNTTGQLKTECAELSLRCSKVEDQSNTAQQALSQCAEKYNSQLSVVENAKQEIASLQKCIEHLKEAEPDTRVLDGLRVTEELGKLYKETSEELLQLKVSEADLLRLRERNAELTREVSEGAAKIAVLTKEKERKRALEKEAGRVPTLKKKIEELSFAVEKGEWDKKVANTHHDEELAKCAAVIAELQHDIGVLRGEVDAEEVQENKPFDD